ncbi:MAG: hypothetical protein NVSMB34_00880 [Variovorax sp.]
MAVVHGGDDEFGGGGMGEARRTERDDEAGLGETLHGCLLVGGDHRGRLTGILETPRCGFGIPSGLSDTLMHGLVSEFPNFGKKG